MKSPRPFLPRFLAVWCVPALFISLMVRAQSVQPDSSTPQWQIDAGGTMAFDVASVKADTAQPSPTTVTANMPMGPGDYYSPTGGLFSATNISLIGYINFAYKLSANQIQVLRRQLPKWFCQIVLTFKRELRVAQLRTRCGS